MGRFINADAFASTGQGILGNNMFAYCNNDPVNKVDPTGEFYIDWDLLPNQEAGRVYAEWYLNTDENETDEKGNLTLGAKIKRTFQAINRDLEIEAGLGVGVGQVQEVLDAGVSYTMYFDIVSVQYADELWELGQRLVLSLYASALLPIEFGIGADGFSSFSGSANGDMWLGRNYTQDSITIVAFANYSYFIGGNFRIGLDIVSFAKTMSETWG